MVKFGREHERVSSGVVKQMLPASESKLILFPTFILLGVTVAFALIALFHAGIQCDSGYTLPMAQSAADGARWYRDVWPTHITAVIWFFAALIKLWRFVLGPSTPPYELFLVAQFFVIFVCGLFTFRLLRFYGRSRDDAMFGFVACMASILLKLS